MADNVLGIAGVVDIGDIQKTFDELIGKLESVGIKTNELSGKMTKALNDISASNADMATKQKQSLEVLKSGLEQAKTAIMQYPEKLREAKNEVENTERAITKLEGELSKLRGELSNQVIGSKGFDELQGKIAGVEAQLSNNRQSLQQHTVTLENLQGAYQNVITLYGTASAAVGANASTHALNAVSVGLEAVQHTANTAEIGKETQAINESNAAKQQQMKSANESVQMLSAEAEAIERVIAKFNEGKVSESEYASVIADGTRFIEEREKQLLSLREEMRKQMEIASTTKYDKDYNVTNQGEIDAATKAYDEYSVKVSELDKALTQLREKLRELQGAHDSVAQKQKEQEQATQQVADNEKKATSAYEQSKQKVDELQAKLEELKQKKEDILRVGNSDFFIPQVPADMLANSGNTFGSETLENLRSVNAEIRQTETELSNAKDKVAEMNEQLQQARQATAAQNAEASRANDPFGVQGSSAKELKERIAECKNTLESLNAEADKLANKDNLTQKQQEQFAELNQKIRETRQEQEACQQQLDAITPTWQKVIEKIKGYGSSLGDAMTGHGKFQQSLGQMGNAFGSLGAPIKGAIGGVVSMTKALWAMCATPIGAIISAVVIGLQALTTWFRKSAEGQRAFSVISAFVGSILSSLTDILVKVGKYLFHAFADANGPMNAFANGLVTTLKSAVKTASDLLSGLGDMVRGVVQAFQGNFEAAWEYIKNGGLKIANGLGGALNTVANAFTTTMQGVWGTMKMIGSGAQEIFNSNLAGGIGDMMNKARQAAQLAKQEHDNTIAMADAREHALELEKQIAANKEKIYTLSGKEKDALIEQTKLLEKQKYEGWTDDNGVQHKGILQTQREALSIAEQQHNLHTKSLEQIKQERELRMQILTTEKEQAASTRMLTRQQEANRKAMENAEKQKLKQGAKQTAAVNKANAKLGETVYTNENARIKAEQDLEDKIALAKIQAMQRGFERTQAEREREAKNELEKIEQQHKEALEAERKRQKAEHDAQQEIIKARGGKVVEWDNSMFDTNTDAVKKINDLYAALASAVMGRQIQNERDAEDKLIESHASYIDKKAKIDKDYADTVAEINAAIVEAEKRGDTERVSALRRSLAEAAKARNEQQSALSLEQLKKTPEYIRAFEDLGNTSSETLNLLISDFERAKDAAAKSLDPEKLREYTNTLQQMYDELNSRNPFESFAKSAKEMKKAQDELSSAQNILQRVKNGEIVIRSVTFDEKTKRFNVTQWDEESASRAVAAAKDAEAKAYNKVLKAITACSQQLTNFGSAMEQLGNSIGGTAGDIFGVVGGMANSIGSVMGSLQNVNVNATGLSAVLQKVSVVGTAISAMIDMNAKLDSILPDTQSLYEHYAAKQREINVMQQNIMELQIDQLEDRLNKEHWIYENGLTNLRKGAELNKEYLETYGKIAAQPQEIYQNAGSGFSKWAPAIIGAIVGIVAGVLTFGAGAGPGAALGAAIGSAIGGTAIGAALGATTVALIGTAIFSGVGAALGNAVRAGIDGITYDEGQTAAINNMRVQTRHMTFFRSEKTQDLESWVRENWGQELFEEVKGVRLIDPEVARKILEDGPTLVGETRETLEKLTEYSEKIHEFLDDIHEQVSQSFSPLVDNLTDALWDWLNEGKDVMDSFREYASDTFKDIAKDALKAMASRLIFEPFQEQLEDLTIAYATGQIDETAYMLGVSAFAKEAQTAIENYLPSLENAVETIQMAFDNAGIDITDKDVYQQKGSTGAWESLGEDTGKELNGRFTALQITGESILVQTIEQTTILTDIQEGMILTQGMITEISSNIGRMIEAQNTANDHLEAISRNTYQLYEMRDDIKEIVKKVKNV